MTNIPSTRPKRPHTSFEQYILMLNPTKNGDFPCINCGSDGHVRDPLAVIDPVEGYKMAGFVTCRTCKGTGAGTLAGHRAEYGAMDDMWAADITEWDNAQQQYRDAMKKLTPADKKALGL